MPIRTGPQLRTSGILTFMRAARGTVDTLEPGMLAIVGVPYETSTPWKRGPLIAPRAYRETSLYYWAHADPTEDVEVEIDSGQRIDPTVVHRVLRDLGDLRVSHVDWARTEGLLRETSRRIVERRTCPVFLGGDHFITYPLALGYADAVRSAADRARRISEIDVGSPANMFWIGIQGWVTEEQLRTIERNGRRVFTAIDVHELGPAEVARRAGERASAGCDYVYLSVDFIDTGFFPATGSVVNDAITPGMLLQILEVLARYPVKAMDFVEVSPRADPTGRSTLMSTELLLGMLGPRLFTVGP
jgi:arginase family enzyme